jgi:hypothetical protein
MEIGFWKFSDFVIHSKSELYFKNGVTYSGKANRALTKLLYDDGIKSLENHNTDYKKKTIHNNAYK